MATRARKWVPVETVERGKHRTRLVYTRTVLWYHVLPDRPVLLVISRDPEGKEKDDFTAVQDNRDLNNRTSRRGPQGAFGTGLDICVG